MHFLESYVTKAGISFYYARETEKQLDDLGQLLMMLNKTRNLVIQLGTQSVCDITRNHKNPFSESIT